MDLAACCALRTCLACCRGVKPPCQAPQVQSAGGNAPHFQSSVCMYMHGGFSEVSASRAAFATRYDAVSTHHRQHAAQVLAAQVDAEVGTRG